MVRAAHCWYLFMGAGKTGGHPATLHPNLPWSPHRPAARSGAVAIREVVAVAAVAIIVVAAAVAMLEVAGFDVGGWMREQLGVTSSG
jgi:hypothetical protein